MTKIKEEIDNKMKEYEQMIQKNQEEKSLKMSEIDERIKLIEKNNLINDELNIIKKDMTFVKNEIQNLKSAKVNDINNTKIEIQKKNK